MTALEDARRQDFFLVASSANAAAVPIELPVVAVVIPAYRAASTVASVIAGVPTFVRHVVVVDDGSGDATSQVVRDLRDPRVDLVEHERNEGVGAAVMTGYERAVAVGADIVAKMDADGQMDPDHLLALITPIVIGRADYTKGNRFLHGRELRSMPGRRRFGNAGLSFMTKLASGYWDIFDPTNGYTAIHASLIPLLGEAPIGKRYFFESSMLLGLSLLRGVVRDVYIPARYPPGATSHLSESRAALQFPWRLLRGFIRRMVLHYFVRDFTAVSLYLVFGVLLGLFGLIWGVWHWAISAQAGVPATTGTVMIAVLPIIVGVQLLLQALTLDIENVPKQPVHASVRLVTADRVPVKRP
ncbi:MAG: glycosyltransferase family 2 protein [Candidatus Limnocylindria bacterium]